MVDIKTIKHIAHLSRLSITDEQAKKYSEDLSKMLSYFDQISKVPTDKVEPLVCPTDIQIQWRKDAVEKESSAEEMTANAPAKTGALFKVPPVI